MKSINAKFGITTKSGRSVVVEAKDYNEAQRIADTKYGKGCIVDLVGNACENCGSTSPVVANALAWKAKNAVACNDFNMGDFKPGMKIEERRFGGQYKIKAIKGGKLVCESLKTGRTEELNPWDVGTFLNSAPVARNADKFLRGIDFGGDAYGKLFVDGDMSFYVNPNSMKGAFNMMLGSPDRVIGEAKKALNGAKNMVHYLEKIIPWLEKNANT